MMSQLNVLVVDDDQSIRDVLKTALEDEGYKVTLASSAEEALDILKENKIFLQLIDLQLPGMTGLELIERVRKENPLAIYIAMTGHVSVFHLIECREMGFDDYFVKPLNMKLLFDSINTASKRIQRWRKGK